MAFTNLILHFEAYIVIKFGGPGRILCITDTSPHFSRKVFSPGLDYQIMPGAFIEYKATIKSTKLLNEDDFNIEKGFRFHEPHVLQRLIVSIPRDRRIHTNYIRLDDLQPKTEERGERKECRGS